MKYIEHIKEFIITAILTTPWAFVIRVLFVELSKNHTIYEDPIKAWVIALTGMCLILHILYVRDVSKMLLKVTTNGR